MMLSISQTAKATGLSVKAIRYYETINLIIPPRDNNNYRYYPETLLEQLHFIKSTKDAGFNLKESKALLRLCANKNRSSADVKAIAEQKIAELQTRIEQQQTLLNKLKKITAQCHGDNKPDCPIIDALADLKN
jgi:MerR family copper efflux transcriptional regulator